MKKKVLLGLGNPLGRDDAVGLYVARIFSASGWEVLAASAPENVIGAVEKVRPKKVVVVDAADMGLPPGTIRRLPPGGPAGMWGSTHGLPLSFLLSLLRPKEVVIIGIQPKDYGVGEGLSPEVKRAAETLVQLLKEGREREIPEL